MQKLNLISILIFIILFVIECIGFLFFDFAYYWEKMSIAELIIAIGTMVSAAVFVITKIIGTTWEK